MKNWFSYLPFLVLLNIVLFGISMTLGRYSISYKDILYSLLPFVHAEAQDANLVSLVLYQVRLPRIISAMLVGAGLGITGATFQGVFRNPLVSPYILGVSSGGGFGAALAILFFNHPLAVQGNAFLFGLIAVGLTFTVARLGNTLSTYTLVLAGVVVGSFFSALISLLKYVADTYTKLPAIVFWLMGSLAPVKPEDLLRTGPVILICIVFLIMLRWRLNILSLGDQQAKALGINTAWLYTVIVICSTLIAASIVSLAGIIGWVGLVVPHLCRMLYGADHNRLLPASALLGSAYMIVVDDVARALMAQEIPIGIVTAIIGAPFFAYLLKRNKGGLA
jgi:iron complex transport system permease protein